MNLRVGMILFDDLTQLDLTGPYEVFSRIPGTTVHLVSSGARPVRSERGLTMLADMAFDEVPRLDVVCVPGGIGVNRAMEDEVLLEFLRAQSAGTRFVTSVCTGALVLGAAGLLRGCRAATHWLSLDLLPLFGAVPVAERVVADGNRVTSAGVTAGIDLGLTITAELAGEETAAEIQLMMEYAPSPRHARHGSPITAAPDLVQRVVRSRQAVQSERRAIALRAAGRLNRSSIDT